MTFITVAVDELVGVVNNDYSLASDLTYGNIPRRRGYPQEEVDLNPENHKAALNRMSQGDSYLSRVWLDCNPNYAQLGSLF